MGSTKRNRRFRRPVRARVVGRCVRATAIAALTALMLILAMCAVHVDACVGGPSDAVAVEVVLNKPGITYNFSLLRSLKGVTVVNEDTVAYRSHLSKEIAVTVSLQRVSISDNATKYLTVRIQPPLNVTNVTEREYVWNYRVEEVAVDLSTLKNAATDLGWRVEHAGESHGYGFKAYLTKEWGTHRVKISIAGINAKTGVDLYIKVIASDNSEEVVQEVRGLIRALTGKEVQVVFEERTYTQQVMSVNEDVVKAVLAYELKWLSETGIISGLSNNDILSIVNASKPGYAGWNSRLVYVHVNGKQQWLPYYDAVEYIPGATLVRGGCIDITELIRGKNLEIPAKTHTYSSIMSPSTTYPTVEGSNLQALMMGLVIGAVALIVTLVTVSSAGVKI